MIEESPRPKKLMLFLPEEDMDSFDDVEDEHEANILDVGGDNEEDEASSSARPSCCCSCSSTPDEGAAASLSAPVAAGAAA